MASIQFPQFNEWEPITDGLEGNFQAEPRVFVHDALNVVVGSVGGLKDLSGGEATSAFVDGAVMATSGGTAGKGLTLKINASGGIVTGVEIIDPGGQRRAAGADVANYAAYVIGEVITIASPGAGADATLVVDSTDIPNTQKRGCCLYVGVSLDLTVVLEGGNQVTFKAVPAGSFLPVLVKKVINTLTDTGDVIALY